MNGEILKKLRKEANLTQDELAQKIGVAPSTIRMIELGKRSGNNDTIDKIATFFNVSLDYLHNKNNVSKNNCIKKESLIDKFIDDLIEDGIIEDPNNIDDETFNMIINTVKTQIALKMKKRNNL